MAMVWVDRVTGFNSPLTLADHYRGIEEESLVEMVPEAIREHFATAQNLVLYSWFVYRFIPVAQLHLYSCLEFALRDRLGLDNEEKPPTLDRLLKTAHKRGLFDGVTFRDRHRTAHPRLRPGSPAMTDGEWFMWLMADYIKYFRNNLAHGAITLMPDGGRALRVVSDAVNHLYRPATA